LRVFLQTAIFAHFKDSLCFLLQKPSQQEPQEFSSLCDVISELVKPVTLPWMKLPGSWRDASQENSSKLLLMEKEGEGEIKEPVTFGYKPLAIKKLNIQPSKKKKRKENKC